MNSKSSPDSGFSLIEVTVVVAMIALMASLSFAVVTQIQSSAKKEKLNSDADTLNGAGALKIIEFADAASLETTRANDAVTLAEAAAVAPRFSKVDEANYSF